MSQEFEHNTNLQKLGRARVDLAISSGFDPKEISFAVESIPAPRALQESDIPNAGIVFAYLGQVLEKEKFTSRINFLKWVFLQNFRDSFTGKFIEVVTKPQNEKFKTDLDLILKDIFLDDDSLNSYFSFSIVAVSNKKLFSLLGGSVDSLINIKNSKTFKEYSYKFPYIAQSLAESPVAEKFIDTSDVEGSFLRIVNMGSFDIISKDSALADLFLELDRDSGWDNRTKTIQRLFRKFGIPFVTRSKLEAGLLTNYSHVKAHGDRKKAQETFEDLMKASDEKRAVYLWNYVKGKKINIPDFIKKLERKNGKRVEQILTAQDLRRESLLNPLNSSGIVKKNGFEIEYTPPEFERFLELNQVLEDFGFHLGGGGEDAEEISPGPFYSPDVANKVFDIFYSSGVIDIFNKWGMTYHFNIGVAGSNITPLIRGMHLTGAAFNTARGYSKSVLLIYSNKDKGYGKYTEAKAFTVVTPHGFRWNHKNTTYLSYAFGAWSDLQQQKMILTGNLGLIQDKLSGVWEKYHSTIFQGLESIGMEGFLNNFSNETSSALSVVSQLQKIFSEPMARYGGLGRISAQTHDPDILPVSYQDKIWPNISAFATDATKVYAGQVMRIIDDLELKIVDEIKYISRITYNKEGEISKFFIKYNIPWSLQKPLEAFEKVKNVMFLA